MTRSYTWDRITSQIRCEKNIETISRSLPCSICLPYLSTRSSGFWRVTFLSRATSGSILRLPDHMSTSYCGPDCAHSRHALPAERSTSKEGTLGHRTKDMTRGSSKTQQGPSSLCVNPAGVHFARIPSEVYVLPCRDWGEHSC